ncbi:MAG: VWFA-related Acidobacterial domain protein [Acidobacteria bacterium]|nr:VWFA-related Acidobacterial domain protein [Acidobacteriota bacterium]
MRTLFAAGAALLLAFGTSGTAQQPPPPPAQTPPADPQAQPPVFRAGINYVRVDVIISDKAGNPVADLQPADFEVLEDGKPQKIDTFKLVKLDGGTADSLKEPPKEIRNDFDEESEAARDDVRLFAIFLDDYHVRRGASMAVRGQLARFIDTQIGPSDMVGVMYPLEATGAVRMTRNHSAVSRGLQQFLGRKFEYEPKNQFEENYAHYPTEVVERVRNQVSLSALKALIVHMGSLKEGRKSLILVSEGYTNIIPPQMRSADAQQPGSGNPAAGNPFAGQNDINEDRAAWSAGLDMDSDLREIFDTANRNNVAIYAVDPRGLPGFEFDINEGVGLQTDSKYLSSTMDTLRTLAENTDGRAIVNRNDIAVGMKQITRDASAYYLIGYNSAQAPTDGKFHEIKVKVKRAGVQVRSRKGYWALSREEVARATAPAKPAPPKPVEAAIASAVIRPSRASVVRSWIGMSRGENGKTRVTYIWEPLPKAPGDRPREEPARVSLMAIAPDGSPSFRGKVPDVALASTSPTAPASGGPSAARAPSRVAFDVNPGKIQLRISVEGSAAQVLDSETREISVPDLTAAQATLGTPSVLRARTAREFQQLRTDPDAVPIAGREFNRIEHLLVRVPAYGPGGTTPVLSVHLLNRTGAAMNELKAEAAPRTGEQQIDLPLAGLPPGDYVLEIKAADPGGDATELVGFRIAG